MTAYLTPSQAIGFLPDTSFETLFVIGFPNRRTDPVTPAVLAFPSADVSTLYTPAMAKHVQDTVPPGSAADLLIVVVGDGRQARLLPHRAAIAALETALRPAGHTVAGCYWTTHTQPGAILRDYRQPTRINAVLPTTAPVDLTPPIRIVADAALPWGLPFTDRGEAIPVRLGRFARTVLALAVRRDDRTHDLITHALAEASDGELPDDETGFALTCALRDNALYGPLLIPPVDLDLRRVEQLWLALYRGSSDHEIQAKLATLIATSALRRRAPLLAAYALAHATGAPGTGAIGVLLQQRTTGVALHRELERLATRVAAARS
jgi:hypothetical protein